MARYIDADKLKELVNGRSSHWLNEWDTLGVLAVIDETPIADVIEVKHGKWCEGRFGNGITVPVSKYYICNQCNHTSQKKTRCCPNCGAKMDLKEAQNDA